MATCFMAAAMAGAFCLRLSVVVPLATVCNSANAVLTCCTLGWRIDDAETSAFSRLVLTSAIAVVSAVTPSSAGLSCVSLERRLSAATSAQAVVGVAVVGADVVGARLSRGNWFGSARSCAAARQYASSQQPEPCNAIHGTWSRICVLLEAAVPCTLHPRRSSHVITDAGAQPCRRRARSGRLP